MKNCRRWRRRSSNVSNSLKSKKGWLETHIWHSKRCKMIDFWGYKVAAHLNEKCFKSTFRSSQKGSLLHDMSYYHAYWINSINMTLFETDYPINNIVDLVIEKEAMKICPLRFIFNTFEKPLMYIHPAVVQSGMLDEEFFINFMIKYSIKIESTSSICTFALIGSMTDNVFHHLFKQHDSKLEFPFRAKVSDPRLFPSDTPLPNSSIRQDELFISSSPVSEEKINILKSEVFLSEHLDNDTNESIPISISSFNGEYIFTCPKEWGRILWYKIVQIKPIKVAGIKQMEMISFENECPVFPRDYVHSRAYEIWSESEKNRLEAIHYAKPLSKRHSFQKLGVSSPFKSDFESLGRLKFAFLNIVGKGTVSDYAEIYSLDKILIGYVTTSLQSSLTHGSSSAIASVSESFSNELVLVRNYSSLETYRTAKIRFLN